LQSIFSALIVIQNTISHTDDDDDDDHVNEVILRLELQPPIRLLFIPQVIYEHKEPWWNDIYRRTPLILQLELWQSYQQTSSTKASGTGKGNDEFILMKYLCSYFKEICNMP
jgi:hypothetical protein